jgi:hypothetical protein
MTPTKKTDESGRELLVYDDGTIKDAKTGHFLRGPTDNPVTRDPLGMLQRRNELSRQIAREAVDEGAGLDPSQWGTGEGWRKVIKHTVQVYLQSKNIRGMGEVLGRLGTVTGYLSTESEKGSDPYSDEAKAISSVTALVDLLREVLQPEAVNGKVIE